MEPVNLIDEAGNIRADKLEILSLQIILTPVKYFFRNLSVTGLIEEHRT